MGPAIAAARSAAGDSERSRPGSADTSGCPFHTSNPAADVLAQWLESGLLCSAGRREFKNDRYHVAHVRDGADYARELAEFRRGVGDYRKTGFLAIYRFGGPVPDRAEDELWHLGRVMRDAGLAPSVAGLINGETVEVRIAVACPVTDQEAAYSFFPVAFCQNAANPHDPLYDPSLSAPFTAINMTSDAFAFARLVREQAFKVFGRPPAEVRSRAALEPLFRKCVTMWQNMSANTILSYGRVAERPERAVRLDPERRFWIAPHNDPVFGELAKHPHLHEMPSVYAPRLCERWLAALFDGKHHAPGRDGQAGGRPLGERQDEIHELHQS